MVLAHLVLQCGYQFSLAHCNYKLRREASDLDEALVIKWASENNKQVFLKTFDLSEEEGSIQLKARNLRYNWFKELIEKEGFDYVLTAHHADDNLETFFINLTRGTGLDGLTGIPQVNQSMIRPLLLFTKNTILDYANSEGIQWREDESNAELNYLRNRIRHEIVPKLLEINPSFLSNFQQTQEYVGFSSQLLDNYRKELTARLFLKSGNSFHILVAELQKLQPLAGYLYLLFKFFGFTQWDDLAHLLEAQSGKEIRSKSHRIIKDREHLILTPLVASSDGEYQLEVGEKELRHPVSLKIGSVNIMEVPSSGTIFVDKEKLNYPFKTKEMENWRLFLSVRNGWKEKTLQIF